MTRVLRLQDTPEHEATRLFVAAVPGMVEDAREAAKEQSYSYRNFNVGLAYKGLKADDESGRWMVETGTAGNVKSRRSKDKICAEQIGIGRAEKDGIEHLGGLVVAGTCDRKKIAEVNPFEMATLWPCVPCTTGVLDTSPLVLPDTPIVTVGLERPIWQVHTPRRLELQYAEGIDIPAQYGFQNWDRRVATFDQLVMTQAQLPKERQVSVQILAVQALSANLLAA